MEMSISLDELHEILDAARKAEWRHMKFTAALKGVDIGGDEEEENLSKEERFEQMRFDAEMKARAMSTGRSEEEVRLEEFGVSIISELE